MLALALGRPSVWPPFTCPAWPPSVTAPLPPSLSPALPGLLLSLPTPPSPSPSPSPSRQVVAGLKQHISREELTGRLVALVLNLKPAKLAGELSEAMILAADHTAVSRHAPFPCHLRGLDSACVAGRPLRHSSAVANHHQPVCCRSKCWLEQRLCLGLLPPCATAPRHPARQLPTYGCCRRPAAGGWRGAGTCAGCARGLPAWRCGVLGGRPGTGQLPQRVQEQGAAAAVACLACMVAGDRRRGPWWCCLRCVPTAAGRTGAGHGCLQSGACRVFLACAARSCLVQVQLVL